MIGVPSEATSSSDDSKLSTEYFERILEVLKGQRLQPSTRDTYHKIWSLFNRFFIKLDVKPNKWEDRLALFITYLVETRKTQSSTARSYCSAIRTVLKMDDIEISDNSFLLSSLTRACKMKNDRLSVRLPIRKSLLNLIV